MAHQRQSSSSSTIIAASTAFVAPNSTPSSSATTRRTPQSSNTAGTVQVRARSATGYGGIDSSPISTATATSSSGSSSSHSTGHGGRRNQHSSSFAENKSSEAGTGYFSRHQPANTARKALGSPPSSPTQSPSLPTSQTVGRRDIRVADQRRKTAPQSMIVAGSVSTHPSCDLRRPLCVDMRPSPPSFARSKRSQKMRSASSLLPFCSLSTRA
ncbi:hypothetical protein GGI06_005756 [Coemansia sp. S85]|nr:hypothetical protein GGI06_005756 [Coemansia sp. S85]